MITYTLYALKGINGDVYDPRGETLILAALRVMQDCPGNAITSRRVDIPYPTKKNNAHLAVGFDDRPSALDRHPVS